jgi:phosphohistidine phosphatase
LEEFASLAPAGDIQTWLSWLEQWRQTDSGTLVLALVGHQPNLGQWAEILVWGEARDGIALKKAGVVGLTLPETGAPIGRSQLFLLTQPKFLL